MYANALQGYMIQTVQHMWERIRTKEGCRCKGKAASELFGKNLSTFIILYFPIYEFQIIIIAFGSQISFLIF